MEAIVIGAGIVGSSIAWCLARRGMSVALFEAGTAGCEASGASAGMLAPGGEFGGGSPWTARALESLAEWPAFAAELSEHSRLPIDYRACGALDFAYSESEWDELRARAQAQAGLGIRSTIAGESDASPYCEPGFRGALYYPDDAIVDPRDVMSSLTAVCRNFLREHCAVLSIELKPDSVIVNTAGGSLEAQCAVLAAGAWSSAIADCPESFAVKGQLNGYLLPAGSIGPVLRRGHTYVLQRGSGYTIAGSTAERIGIDRTVNALLTGDIHARAESFVPLLRGMQPANAWCGLRPATASLEPEVRRVPGSNLWLAYGHYRNGVLLAPVTARLVADEIAQ